VIPSLKMIDKDRQRDGWTDRQYNIVYLLITDLSIIIVIDHVILIMDFRFVKRLCYFYKPSSGLFCKVEQTYANVQKFSAVGSRLMQFLLGGEEGIKLAQELVTEITACIRKVKLYFRNYNINTGQANLINIR
jgi:hypothetical protein